MAYDFRHLRGEFLNMDLREFASLAIFFERYPGLMRPAVATVLNELGFRWRPLAVSTLASRLIMRNPRFALSRMQVEKTSARPIPQQRVTIGSTFARGKSGNVTFDGWRSLQGNEREVRSRTLALMARGGQRENMARPSGKLMPGANIPKPEDWDDIRLPQSRVAAMIRVIAESSVYGKRMIIPKGNRFAPGLYGIKSRRGYILPSTGRSAPRVRILQHFGKAPRHARWRWMDESVNRLMKHSDFTKLWERALMAATLRAQKQSGITRSY